MSRFLILGYGLLGYAIGMGGLTYFILFVGGFDFLPIHINSGTPADPSQAMLINLGLIALFGIQHSVMARPSFKKLWTKFVPEAAERSTYVLISGVMMLVICAFWQPIDGTLWQVNSTIGWWLLTGGYAFGWVFAVTSTFLINHFELFGLQQVYYNLRNEDVPEPTFTSRFFYNVVRHPLQLGILMGIWITPNMSLSHLCMALGMSIYIFVGLYFEEQDLTETLGQDYKDYQERVPMILPLPQ